MSNVCLYTGLVLPGRQTIAVLTPTEIIFILVHNNRFVQNGTFRSVVQLDDEVFEINGYATS